MSEDKWKGWTEPDAADYKKTDNFYPMVNRQASPSEMLAANDVVRASLKRAKNGEPLLDAALIVGLCFLVRCGNTIENSCRIVGLRQKTIEKWVAQGEHDLQGDDEAAFNSVYAELTRQLLMAIGDQEDTLVKFVFKGLDKAPDRALAVLAVRRPESWAPTMPEPVDYRKQLETMDPSALRKEVQRLMLKAGPTPGDNGKG